MKKLFCIMMLWMFFSSAANAQTIRMAYVDFPPYEYIESNAPKGILVTIVQKVFKNANIPMELVFLPFKRAYDETEKGNIDGLFNFYKTEDRLKSFDYSEPIIENPLVFFVKKGSQIQFNKMEDLKGLRIGAMLGYTYGSDFDNSKIFTIEQATSHVTNFKKLILRRIDAYPCDKLVGIYISRNENILSDVDILPNPLKLMEGHIGFIKGKHKGVIEKINKEIKLLKEKGEIDAIVNKFIGDMK